MADFLEAVQVVLSHEGGYIEHPDDPGGATNWGISLRFAQSFNSSVTKEDIKNMSREDAITYYFDGFWAVNRYEKITCDIIATKVFDFCVNAGARVANETLQKACNHIGSNLTVDGIVGTKTLTVTNSLNCVALITQMRILMREFYQELVKNNKNQSVFSVGWQRRADW